MVDKMDAHLRFIHKIIYESTRQIFGHDLTLSAVGSNTLTLVTITMMASDEVYEIGLIGLKQEKVSIDKYFRVSGEEASSSCSLALHSRREPL
ncbi:hypothetical protein CDAR_590171 [Caerostris darwini]|uniref:Uncharacterized protein n=1 Tax=Caerostris darwini TaxID=1538125 RepID=A0AAV4NT74_9ARAC|nr:hypothetical protein CDAR_590171 [Caerostris darwini]